MTRVPAIHAAALLVAVASWAPAQVLINSAGATFPYPVYARWLDEFHRLRPDALINYQSIGSGAAMRQLQAGALDLGATDMPLSDAEMAQFPDGVLHFPTVVGAVAPVYNLPGVNRDLNFTAEALAGVFLGRITVWNDPELAAANPDVRLPAAGIVVVRRSDRSGTTFILSDFLSKTSPEWRSRLGAGNAIPWAPGIGAKGNEGVAGIVRQTAYSIGYAELLYAEQNRMTYGRVRNAAGNFTKAGTGGIRAAAATVAASMPSDFRVSITNAQGKDAYPLASYTWLVTPARIADSAKRRVIVEFLQWALTKGQSMAEPFGYAPLPGPVAARALKACDAIR